MSRLLYIFAFILLAIGPLTSCKPLKPIEEINRFSGIEFKVDSLLSLMTLEEKIGQMSQVRHFNDISGNDVTTKFIGSIIHTEGPSPGTTAEDWQKRFIVLQKQALSTRLGIPLLFAVDAVHGQNTFNGATIFPHNIGLGATNNEELVKQIANITAIEAQATGFNWVFSPCVAISYNEKWGRFYESFSESAEITSKLTKASINGHQGDLSSSTTVLATAKHYVAEGATDYGLEGGVTSLEISEINDRVLTPYRIAVQQGVGSVMVAFNTVSGLPLHAHKELITDTLKGAMQFDGFVVSDWRGYTRFGRKNIINAGVDMVMAVNGDLDFFQSDLYNAVDSGFVSVTRIDDAVRRILRQKFMLGLFQNPFPDTLLAAQIGSKKHREVAKQAVQESLVLLKNENHTLPISANKKIVVVGEHANNAGLQSGGWTIHWQGTDTAYKGATTILEGIKQTTKAPIYYDSLGEKKHTDADIAIIVVGETPYAEFFGDIGNEDGKYQLTLSDKHKAYIDTYSQTNAKVVVILVSGRPLVVTEQIEKSNAFVAAWLPGSEAQGIADVLFGKEIFKGKLPHSWPRSKDNFKGKYGPNYWNKENKPLYPIGYGLTYDFK